MPIETAGKLHVVLYHSEIRCNLPPTTKLPTRLQRYRFSLFFFLISLSDSIPLVYAKSATSKHQQLWSNRQHSQLQFYNLLSGLFFSFWTCAESSIIIMYRNGSETKIAFAFLMQKQQRWARFDGHCENSIFALGWTSFVCASMRARSRLRYISTAFAVLIVPSSTHWINFQIDASSYCIAAVVFCGFVRFDEVLISCCAQRILWSNWNWIQQWIKLPNHEIGRDNWWIRLHVIWLVVNVWSLTGE